MKRKKQSSPKERANLGTLYFELQADWGLTKHMGGLKSTEELIGLCHIKKGKYILEVGCGTGITACHIAKKYGCKVVGVDTSERMIERSKERAKREGVGDRAEFRTAGAQKLPFRDSTFDAVISEFVTAFPKDKQGAVNEYVRVAKPGGCIGLNEMFWIKTPPPELVGYMFRVTGAEFLTSDGWKGLLEGSGLRDIQVRTYKINMLNDWINEIRRLDFTEYPRIWYRFLSGCITNPAYRRFIKETLAIPISIFKFTEYAGYGIYVGRK